MFIVLTLINNQKVDKKEQDKLNKLFKHNDFTKLLNTDSPSLDMALEFLDQLDDEGSMLNTANNCFFQPVCLSAVLGTRSTHGWFREDRGNTGETILRTSVQSQLYMYNLLVPHLNKILRAQIGMTSVDSGSSPE